MPMKLPPSGIITVQQFEDDGDDDDDDDLSTDSSSKCRLCWRITASPVNLTSSMDSGEATKVYGELFQGGLKAYEFWSPGAELRISQQDAAVKVIGSAEIKDLHSGVSLQTRAFVWNSSSHTLSLEGVVSKPLNSNWIVSSLTSTDYKLSSDFENTQSSESGPIFKELVERTYIRECCPSYLCMFGVPSYIRLTVPGTVLGSLNHDLPFGESLRWLKPILARIGLNLGRLFLLLQKNSPLKHNEHSETQVSAILQSNARVIKNSRKADDGRMETFFHVESGFIMDLHKGLISLPQRLQSGSSEKDIKTGTGFADTLFKKRLFFHHKGHSAVRKAYHLKSLKVTLYGPNSQDSLQHSQSALRSVFLRPFLWVGDNVRDKLKGGKEKCSLQRANATRPFQAKMVDCCVSIPKISSKRNPSLSFGEEYVAGKRTKQTSKAISAQKRKFQFFSWNLWQIFTHLVSSVNSSAVVRYSMQPRGKIFMGLEVGLSEWPDDFYSWKGTSLGLPHSLFQSGISNGFLHFSD